MHATRKQTTALLVAAAAAWPLLYFADFLIPRDGWYKACTNDFAHLYYPYKAYLLDELSHGRLPTWSPSEGAGFPFYSSPFVGAFYPGNLPLLLFRWLAGGYSPLDHQWFTVLGIGVFAVGLVLWLRPIVENPRAILFAVVVMSVSFRLSELLRFPNAIHTVAWYPWILFATGELFRSGDWRRAGRYALLLSVVLVCFLTAGYPYFVYYSLFLVLPYVLVLVCGGLPPYGAIDRVAARRALALAAAASMAALALCSPYLVKLAELLAQTTDRGTTSFRFSTEHGFDIADTVGSLLYPPMAQTEGVYYFSILGLLLLVCYLFLGPLSWRWKAAALAWFAAISSISHGHESLLFEALFRHLPGFASLRVWGRFSVVFVPFLALGLAVTVDWFERRLAGVRARHERSVWWRLAFLVTAALIVGAQIELYRRRVADPYWFWFPHNFGKEIGFPVAGVLALALLTALLLVTARRPLASWLRLPLTTALLVACVLDLRPVGESLWIALKPTPSRRPVDVEGNLVRSFSSPRRGDPTFVSLDSHFNVASPGNWYFQRYIDFYERERRDVPHRDQLLGLRDGRKLFFTLRVDQPDPASFLADAQARSPSDLQVSRYTGDELVVETHTSEDGWLSFIDNWDPEWEARVDGAQVPIHLLFGTFKAVPLAAGRHRVEFTYHPRLRWPM